MISETGKYFTKLLYTHNELICPTSIRVFKYLLIKAENPYIFHWLSLRTKIIRFFVKTSSVFIQWKFVSTLFTITVPSLVVPDY